MKKSYIAAFDESFDFEDVISYIDSIDEITNWATNIKNVIFLISELNAKDISIKIDEYRETRNDNGKYIVAEIGKNKDGWLPRKSWKILSEKSDPS